MASPKCYLSFSNYTLFIDNLTPEWRFSPLLVFEYKGKCRRKMCVPLVLTFFIVLIATVSMKLAVERSRMMEWISQVHLPRDPRDILSRSWLRVSSLLEPRVVVSPSCCSDIHPKLVLSGSPPFRYSHLDCLSEVWGVVGITNTVLFSLSVQICWSLSARFSSMHVSLQCSASSSTENTGTAPSCSATLSALLCIKINVSVKTKSSDREFDHWSSCSLPGDRRQTAASYLIPRDNWFY